MQDSQVAFPYFLNPSTAQKPLPSNRKTCSSVPEPVEGATSAWFQLPSSAWAPTVCHQALLKIKDSTQQPQKVDDATALFECDFPI